MSKPSTTNATEDFDLDDVEVKTGPNKFKVEKDKKYRAAFPLMNENGRVRIQRVDYYSYSPTEDEYYSFLKPDDKDFCEKIEARGAELVTRFVTALLVYRTRADGKMLTPIDWEMQPVVLNNKKVANLKEINAEWDLTTIDLSISSSNPAYQEHTYTPLKDAIWLADKDDSRGAKLLEKLGMTTSIKAEVLDAAKECAKTMTSAVAGERGEPWIREKLGILTKEEEEAEKSAGKVADFEDLDDEAL